MNRDQIVVGIGASAGGLEAINDFFDNMPPDTGMAFVLIQHLSPDFESLMDELLAKHTKMPIQVVKEDTPVRPNHIYLIDRGSNIIIKNKVLKPVGRVDRTQVNMPIDEFFHSLATDRQKYGIAIILSGTGTDGSRGIRTVKENGGLIFVQSLKSARFDGMPKAAIDTGLVDNILSPKKIVSALSDLSTRIHASVDPPLPRNESSEEIVNDILRDILREQGFNFLPYRKTTIFRRIEKRMLLAQQPNLQQYAAYLRKNKEEMEILAREFLIGVTKFFRDPEVFEYLKEEIIPRIFADRKNSESVRVWVAGCSTGEEAYSLAILMEDYLETHNLRREFKIFASDLDQNAIRTANRGTFPSQIRNDVPAQYLSRYFEHLDNGRFRIVKQVRKHIVFTVHDVLHDPPFINMDLISCRNLMIYLEPPVQQRLLQNFQFALVFKGFLLLGPSEALGQISNSFKQVQEGISLFKNLSHGKASSLQMKGGLVGKVGSPLRHNLPQKIQKQQPVSSPPTNESLVDMLLDRYVPTSLVIDQELNLLYANGDFEDLLQFPRSPQLFNLENMTGNEEVLFFKNGIHRIKDAGESILFKDVSFRKKDKQYTVDLRFDSAHDPGRAEPVYVIEFLRKEEADEKTQQVVVADKDNFFEDQLRTLQIELQQTRHERNLLVERLETTNEELQASNEELIAANEEMQSTNEELQSVNEELYTVNAELQAKVIELTEINNDMDNLFRSTDIGTIFIDRTLRIRKFTPAIANQFQLQEQDLGRPITAFVSLLKHVDFVEKMEWVMRHNEYLEEEVVSKDDKVYLMRLTPYLVDGKVDGAVATFINIDQMKEASSKQKTTAQQFKAIFQSSDSFISVISPDGILQDINRAPEGMTQQKMIGDNFFEIAVPKAGRAKAQSAFNKSLETKQVVDFDFSIPDPTGSIRHYTNSMVPILEDGKAVRILGVSKDITQIREIERNIRLSAAIFSNIFRYANEHIIILSTEGEILDINFTDAGYNKSEILGKNITEIAAEGGKEQAEKELRKIQNGSNFTSYETTFVAEDGTRYWYHNIMTPVFENNRIERIILISRDIGDSKRLESELKRDNLQLEALIEENGRELQRKNKELENMNGFMDSFVHGAAHDLRSPLLNIQGFLELLPEVENPEELQSIYVELNQAASRMERVLGGLVELIEFLRKGGPKPKLIHLKKLVNQTIADLSPHLIKSGGNITKQIPAGITINYIEAYLHSIVYNLVHNAIKYRSVDRPLEIKVSAVETDDDLIRFTVSDNGIGMDLENYGHFLFEPFRRLTAQRQGTGIGLSIINNVVSKNGGHIEVESLPNRGSTFHVFLKPYDTEK
ncbi:CheR family methyltransferase [Flavilitoribacter nigricans]|uniref:histidine kinase n=1 Tax=Flavilitoribacter nigricans (strain ATCC 23147 / DSM 23189 / NBRC 102662 / NCIMB 1420 / SS-2) TaxID=1122177 RepID=A0A2D0NHS2_FLAN2|nr:CheR family methyltransferase [Flavilitoribacter nigricans]PHN07926.1 hypothetical protein CRP01_04000 [Flavilitoribacter nigricans DSM 23189 = NBRC 102662]